MKMCKECGNRVGNNSISKLCRRCCRIGQRHSNWKGRIRIPKGYIFLRIPEHPNANKIGYVLEHVYVMSKSIGRPLRHNETVHHKNGIRDDNRLENLELMERAGHTTHHLLEKHAFNRNLFGNICIDCKEDIEHNNKYYLDSIYEVICKKCYMKRRYRANHPLPTTAKTGRDIGGKFIRKIT